MCGEHRREGRASSRLPGSSPHVRGAPIRTFSRCRRTGIIPACAGSTRWLYCRTGPSRDHPRMCGEHVCRSLLVLLHWGSSPHVRGALTVQHAVLAAGGIIPACAGSTMFTSSRSRATRDHPRMCGEHMRSHVLCGVRGGSSPHVRGAHGRRGRRRVRPGIIPACAGSTSERSPKDGGRWDHPRMCGEHSSMARSSSSMWGSSPHVRGARVNPRVESPSAGIIPACAGSTARGCRAIHETKGSSPHVRGAHFENSIIPRKRKDNWLFFIQFRFENFLAFRYLLALLHPFLGVPTKDPSFASLGRLINCNPSQSTGDQSAPYTLKAICCSFLAE